MSLPPESRTMTRESRDTMSMSRDTSPSNINRQRRRSGVYSRHGEELPSSLVSSFTKPRNQSPFTGLLTSKLSYQNGNKSPVNYTKFDNITLSLPQHGAGQSVSLSTLLSLFVSQVCTLQLCTLFASPSMRIATWILTKVILHERITINIKFYFRKPYKTQTQETI